MTRASSTTTAALALAIGLMGGALAEPTLSAFSASTSNVDNDFAAERIFQRSRPVTAWRVVDRSNGTNDKDASDVWSFADGVMYTTAPWGTGAHASRYLDVRLASPLPGALEVRGARLDLVIADEGNAPKDRACFMLETRRASTGAILARHGTPSDPLACVSTRDPVALAPPLREVTTTDIANDLIVRIYAWHTEALPMRIDRAVLTGATPYAPFEVFRRWAEDAADGSAERLPYALIEADGTTAESQSGWGSASDERWMRYSFPPYVPAGADVAGAIYTLSYRGDGGRTCHYFEILAGETVIGMRGAPDRPLACNSSTTHVTETYDIPEVDSVQRANTLSIRQHFSNPGNKTSHDVVTMAITWGLR